MQQIGAKLRVHATDFFTSTVGEPVGIEELVEVKQIHGLREGDVIAGHIRQNSST